MDKKQLWFTLWDAGRGTSIWIRTPNGKDHWIDLGRSATFSPIKCFSRLGLNRSIDFLIVSYPDWSHLRDLPSIKKNYMEIRSLARSLTMPGSGAYAKRLSRHWREYKNLAENFSSSCFADEADTHLSQNGGAIYELYGLPHGTRARNPQLSGTPVISKLNTSLVVMILYAGVLFVCPGDIEPLGWRELWYRNSASMKRLIDHSHARFLVAPRRGHKHAYCEEMMQAITPHAVFVNSVWGHSTIHSGYRSDPLGVVYVESEYRRCFTPSRKGYVQVIVQPSGEYCVRQCHS
ncbi:MAG: hypothetical protein F4X92_10890 [Gammaproteobacteria bacterium]|nr:hypothetical protein [Gammaproteobacteria bacterium]